MAGWDLHPLEKRRLTTAHTLSGHSERADRWPVRVQVLRGRRGGTRPRRLLRFVIAQGPWFFRYRDFSGASGRWDLLGTFTILAGYFQDRLLPSVTFVYDIRSQTGAVLPQVQYRYTEAFSIVVGAQFFAGRPDIVPIAVNGLGPASNQQGRYAYRQASDVGVSIVRHIDNFFVRLRYSF